MLEKVLPTVLAALEAYVITLPAALTIPAPTPVYAEAACATPVKAVPNAAPTYGITKNIATWPNTPSFPINFPKLLKAFLTPLAMLLTPVLSPFHALLKIPIIKALRIV